MSRMRTGAALVLVVALSGCGGSDSAGVVAGTEQGSPLPPPPPPQTASLPWQPCTSESSAGTGQAGGLLPPGYWAGTLTNDANRTTDPFWMIVAPDGRFRAKTYDYYRYYDLEIQWAGTPGPGGDLSATTATVLDDVARDGTTAWLKSERSGELTFAAEMIDNGVLSGDWVDSAGDFGCFSLDFFEGYGDTLLLGDMTGIWTAYGPGSTPQMTFTVDPDGSLIAQDIFGCTATGRVELLDQQFGLFDIQSTISGCPLAGSYAGFATIDFVFYPERTVAIYMDDGTRGLQVRLDD